MTRTPIDPEDERLAIIADICETVPPDRLNNDVAYGISYAIGYLGRNGDTK